ncbi:MAG: PfaD family polyunsaturated fatty acid/polyketide biosynthesis protein, partial [Chitinivibrionales bacterium]|nr:PfaD family polyunsaturated fatty acid/polyketide biosynthesis protein [Chitinivibrionales bacterium]MBD3358933.1 PfaD family polyunsaturated fatty acid/polyketide biosynthesis protein [Chitinivibrionales bacterium]
GFFGAGGLGIDHITRAVEGIRKSLPEGVGFGVNLLHGNKEDKTVTLLLEKRVRNVEAAGYMQVTPALVRYRVTGLKRDRNGAVVAPNRIIAKVSRPEIARRFLCPPPKKLIDKLLGEGMISSEEAELAGKVSLAADLCVEADSGGHTDAGVAYVLMPAMIGLRDDAMNEFGYTEMIHVGAAGGIGTPHAAAAAFILGADFLVTGSINQCTLEAGTSPEVKDLLQTLDVQDTAYAPAGDMFEMGAKVQVVRRAVFFPARANKLYELYTRYNGLHELDYKTRMQLEDRFFQRSFDDIYRDCMEFYPASRIEEADRNSKLKMAFVFRWYFGFSTRMALRGVLDQKVNWQIHCGPSLGAFNRYAEKTGLTDWRNRRVGEIGEGLMEETADLMQRRLLGICSRGSVHY